MRTHGEHSKPLKKKVLVTSEDVGESNLMRLGKSAKVFASWKMSGPEIRKILPEIDALLVFSWPPFLDEAAVARMYRLRFVQSGLVGVNHIPFPILRRNVTVASNAGAYSFEVGEQAWALLLSIGKRIVEQDTKIKEGANSFDQFAGEASKITVLNGRTIGIIGYGAIGQSVSKYALAFGMKVLAFGRKRRKINGLLVRSGRKWFEHLISQSDAMLLSVPLSKRTLGLIGKTELSMMKDDAILVNIARGDLVDQESLYSHLASHPEFRYATDVWWTKNGRETLENDYPFASLVNFIGTPHMSGPTAVVSGRPSKLATDNVLRYLKGKITSNTVDRREYAFT